jgi:hypothetical protein
VPRVTEYTKPNWYGQAFFASSLKLECDRPKSTLTEFSPLSLLSADDSDDDFPRYSQRELRAKPCWGREPVAWSLGGGPKH